MRAEIARSIFQASAEAWRRERDSSKESDTLAGHLSAATGWFLGFWRCSSLLQLLLQCINRTPTATSLNLQHNYTPCRVLILICS